MGLLRSESMRYGMLILPVQDARRYIDRLGKETNVQFEDMNAREMRRPYRKHIQRIDEMERILRFMNEEIVRIGGPEIVKNRNDEFLARDGMYKLDEVEGELQYLYEQFVRFKENNANLVTEKNQAIEESQVMATALKLLGDAGVTAAGNLGVESRRLGHLSGVVLRTDESRFQRAIWRASRGNVFVQFCPIDKVLADPKTGAPVEKSVFVIYFQGTEGAMQDRLAKVCSAFGVDQYAWPANVEMAQARDSFLRKQIEDKERALQAYQQFLTTETTDLVNPSPKNPQGNSKIEDWRIFCIKEKSIYTVLNQCEEGMALRVQVWYPESDETHIQDILKAEREASGELQGAFLNSDARTVKAMPPTYIRTNEYTELWQEVISTYGIPRYQEANPALFTVVTFPFIFGMMYGDVGHGSLLTLVGIWLVRNAEQFRYSQPDIFRARYCILSLGIFATFAGFMYNDFFSIGLPLFNSGFEDNGDGQFQPTYDVTNSGGPGPYPFGLDWAWVGASNELLFVNSLKMKLSVLFGVLQMVMGVCLRWSNAFKEKNMTDLFFECVPMMVFMLCFFGFMDVMILYKWTHPVDNAPNIINSLICMAMGQEDHNPLWEGSVELAKRLMFYTILSVPFMLFPKPFILLYQHNKSKAANAGVYERLIPDEESLTAQAHGEHEDFEFGEVFIHQVIETIEFGLGTVSHTASYLRIWALSLAHQQLSLVFFQKTLSMGLTMAYPMNGVMLYFMFAAWFGITLGVLLGMDVLECFLHTLRLHWVEFQSKFYKAGGEKFAPYNVKELMNAAD